MQHGTPTMYTNGKCRCDDCRRAATRAKKAWRLRRGRVGPTYVDKERAVRKVRALQAIGWTLDDIAHGVGYTDRGALTVLYGTQAKLSVALDRRIDALYHRLSMTPGPSPQARSYAKSRGYAPPLAYDDIDDLDESPVMRTDKRVWADLDEWLFLVRGGEDPERAAKRMGVTLFAIEAQARRKDRPEVLPLISNAMARIKYAQERKSA